VKTGDAYGELMLAMLEGSRSPELVERDDGFINASPFGPRLYFDPFRRWPAHQRRAMRFVRGRVLDVGCGAGRVSLHLQERGLSVVAIDVSPGAADVARRRGVRDVRLLSIDDVDESLGVFDTIVLFGNNVGLLASAAKARQLLTRFHRITSPRARIIGESRDVYATDDPSHRAYHARNRERGRMSGQVRIRVRHRDVATPWFDYLMVSPDELRELAEQAGWTVARLLESEDTYVAVLEKSG
jgi:SAM-dependent methyltransferase